MQLHVYLDMPMPSDTTIEIWIRLTRAQQHILSAIEKALKQSRLPALAWYDVLLELNRADNKGMRPFELQKKLLLPQYSLSRLLDKMEQAGVLERMVCPQDGRGQQLVVSQTGKAMRKRMWEVYRAQLNQAIGEKLNEKDLVGLSALLQKLR